MSKAKTYGYLGATFLAAASLLCACSDEARQMEEPQEETVQLSLTIQTRATTAPDGYEAGSKYENYINVAGGDYRIYFFDSDNKYITTFDSSDNIAIGGYEDQEYSTYHVIGKAPQGLVDNASDFKIVMLANWGTVNYPSDEDLEAGVTTIDDICNATFDAFTNFQLSPSTNLIPFYGVHEYKNVTFNQGEATLLDGSLTLLRAMAKVEVILEENDDVGYEDADFEYVRIYRYNSKGYCAPYQIYSESQYDHNYTYDLDFVDDLRLVNNANDTDTDGKYLTMLQSEGASDGIIGKWIAYVPEYDNSGDDYSYIEVKINYSYTPDRIYFANYTDGETDNTDTSKRYDIHRNYLYRFRITDVNGYLRVHVDKWENTYDNVFEFGNEAD
ncbi:MAG: hypothetical protein LUI09_07185 [Prevotellaceae bacterium]|nr:hypothetical protein [Prevotellaceae bacterium]